VEYHPLEDVEVAEPVFANFCSMLQGSTDPLLGSFKPVSAAFGDFNLGTTYSGEHAHQSAHPIGAKARRGKGFLLSRGALAHPKLHTRAAQPGPVQ
jgi:hypothetical protein